MGIHSPQRKWLIRSHKKHPQVFVSLVLTVSCQEQVFTGEESSGPWISSVSLSAPPPFSVQSKMRHFLKYPWLAFESYHQSHFPSVCRRGTLLGLWCASSLAIYKVVHIHTFLHEKCLMSSCLIVLLTGQWSLGQRFCLPELLPWGKSQRLHVEGHCGSCRGDPTCPPPVTKC